MSYKRITTTVLVEVATGAVISSQTCVDHVEAIGNELQQVQAAQQTVSKFLTRPNTLSIQDSAEVVDAATSVFAVNRTYKEVYADVKKACNKVFHRIADRREIDDSTVRANVIRNTGIGTASALYEGITKFLIEGDVSLAKHLLDCAQTPEEEGLIMEAFKGEA